MARVPGSVARSRMLPAFKARDRHAAQGKGRVLDDSRARSVCGSATKLRLGDLSSMRRSRSRRRTRVHDYGMATCAVGLSPTRDRVVGLIYAGTSPAIATMRKIVAGIAGAGACLM